MIWMKMVGNIIMLTADFVQVLILVYFLVNFFGFRNSVRGCFWKGTVLVLILWSVGEFSLKRGWSDLVYTAIWLLILTIFCKKNLKSRTIQHILWSVFALLCVPMINLGLILGGSFLANMTVREFAVTDNISYLFAAFFSRLLYGGVLYLILHIRKRNKFEVPGNYGVGFGIMFGYSVVIEAILFAGLSLNENSKRYKLGFIGIAVGILLIDLYLIVVMFKISEETNQEEKMKLLKIQNHFQEERLKGMYSEEKKIRQIRHDYKSHIFNIYELLNKEEYGALHQYLSQMSKCYLNQAASFIDTENPVLNAALNTKFSLCREKGIQTYSRIIGNYKEVDGFLIGIILLNLLDNAIEASIPENEKEISLTMVYGDLLNLTVKNKISQSVLERNPGLSTSKNERELHGIGLNHVKEIVAEMDGIFEVYEENGFFCAHCMIYPDVTKW